LALIYVFNTPSYLWGWELLFVILMATYNLLLKKIGTALCKPFDVVQLALFSNLSILALTCGWALARQLFATPDASPTSAHSWLLMKPLPVFVLLASGAVFRFLETCFAWTLRCTVSASTFSFYFLCCEVLGSFIAVLSREIFNGSECGAAENRVTDIGEQALLLLVAAVCFSFYESEEQCDCC
jgi:hypothetical protein